ncbi:hypothetical protein THAOC_30978 [Thalassiosira oceanica]|uniref:Seipin n=1 Tax=Thalassiosira oceanica TaxID=159749 RepID=K0RTV9_THAOC|nr:hypothetical protein THAOC_30978 [Thalassiosira oceanica]|eukprot:EJK50087.1 hypothetical protein THAOC_30978 [Thalassiosira oceanica]
MRSSESRFGQTAQSNFAHRIERAAAEQVKKQVLRAIGADEEDGDERPTSPALAPDLTGALHDFITFSLMPLLLYTAKLCALLVLLLVMSISSYGLIWRQIMGGLEVRAFPVFFDYDNGDFPRGLVDIHSNKQAPWLYESGFSSSLSNYRNDSSLERPKNDSCSRNQVDESTRFEIEELNAVLEPDYKYFFELSLTLPESTANRDIGVFMISVELQSKDRTVLARSRQHSMLPYESPLVSTFRKITLLAPLMSGLLSETRTVHLICFDSYVEIDTQRPLQFIDVRLEVPYSASFPATSRTIQIHSAQVKFGKEMNKLQLLLRQWKYTFFVVGTITIFVCYIVAAVSMFGYRYQRKLSVDDRPYADFLDDNDDEDYMDANSQQGSMVGANIEILEEDEEGDANWEPIDPNNAVTDEDSVTHGIGSAVQFPMGKIAHNRKVKGHGSPFAAKETSCESMADLERKASREKEEKDLADMVLKGKSFLNYSVGWMPLVAPHEENSVRSTQE